MSHARYPTIEPEELLPLSFTVSNPWESVVKASPRHAAVAPSPPRWRVHAVGAAMFVLGAALMAAAGVLDAPSSTVPRAAVAAGLPRASVTAQATAAMALPTPTEVAIQLQASPSRAASVKVVRRARTPGKAQRNMLATNLFDSRD